ncbi:hypothetical protein [Mycolicibacterium sp.]|uniref:hypothetical protein n=1 Tax=Mycolicibacterium sp. TaxID=2320850 RepID=UPI001A27EDCD|nr:hypothetical protein [Mycolicibacterium sp.]MBJ7338749.1 hypothetical protein [Mycolicibacterium sp.]
MGRFVAAALFAGITALGAAIPAAADPADLVPYCSGDQTPMDTNCRAPSSQIFTHDSSGVSPELPYGVDPGNDPAI